MWQALYDFFLNIFQYIVYDVDSDLDIGEYVIRIGKYLYREQVETMQNGIINTYYEYRYAITFTLPQYLSLICSIISLIFIVVLCCLFVYKIIKLIGGLIR